MIRDNLIDLKKDQMDILKEILRRHVPGKEVWAYGSRVTWKASERSDLDLVVFGCDPYQFSDLEEALEESDLLVSANVMEWESLPKNFKENIKRKYVVVQKKKLSEWRERDKWPKVPLYKIIDLIGGGTPKRDNPKYWNGNIPWLSVKDFNHNRRYVNTTEESITELGLGNSSTKILPEGHLIISARGTIGAISQLLQPMAFNQSCYGVNAKTDYTTNDFLYYLIKYHIDNLKRISHGAVFDTITRETFQHIEVSLPPLPEQKAIAEVLSSLDDKTDLLHRQNKTLEDMAHALFRKWFVEDSVEEWEKKPLDKIADYLNGLACQKYCPENEIDKLPVLKIKELRSGISANSDWATSKIDERYIVKRGDIIFSWSGSLMVKIWNGQKCVLNQHLFKVTSEEYPKWFCYFWTEHHLKKFIAIADSKATTMGHIKRGDLSSSMVVVPPDAELLAMNKIIGPLFEKMLFNQSQISVLGTLRDELLPRLINGEKRVASRFG